MPQSRFRRLLLGWGLVLGGILGFLPVVGFWMLPLGIIVLSVDLPFARRLRRRTEVWWGRRKKK
ncbi:MAG: PGPGW domain-containing protein [Sneathiella sp.]